MLEDTGFVVVRRRAVEFRVEDSLALVGLTAT
jgi:hypothetical protein